MAALATRMRSVALVLLCMLTIAGMCQIAGVGILQGAAPVITAAAEPGNSSPDNSSIDNDELGNSSPETEFEENTTPEETITPEETATSPDDSVNETPGGGGMGGASGNVTSDDQGTNETESGTQPVLGETTTVPGNETEPLGTEENSSQELNLTVTSPTPQPPAVDDTPATVVTQEALPVAPQGQENPIIGFFNDILKGFRYLTGIY